MIEIRVQIRGRVFSICIGHKTKWYAQVPLIMIVEEFYNKKGEVVDADCLWSSYYKISS